MALLALLIEVIEGQGHHHCILQVTFYEQWYKMDILSSNISTNDSTALAMLTAGLYCDWCKGQNLRHDAIQNCILSKAIDGKTK